MYKGPEHYLDRDAAASRIMAHARLLMKLGRRFEQVAPGPLRHSARVANFKNGTLIIHTDNGAVAAKLRQMSQRLCAEMSRGGQDCIAMEVKVLPRQPEEFTAPTVKPLTGKAQKTLRDTAEHLPQGPLRAALDLLLERSAKQD